jgi:hypothetical protein
MLVLALEFSRVGSARCASRRYCVDGMGAYGARGRERTKRLKPASPWGTTKRVVPSKRKSGSPSARAEPVPVTDGLLAALLTMERTDAPLRV